MLRRLRGLLVLSLVSIPALAAAQGANQETDQEADQETADQATATPASGTPADPESVPSGDAAAPVSAPAAGTAADPRSASEARTEGVLEGWHMEVHGYFRAPMALGISSRPNPDTPDGPASLQWSYGPNRTMDWSYYSFAYTRLQEQDWAELIFHAKKKHVDAAVGWMGYWLAASGFRNPDAAAAPGMASLTLDTDFEVAGIKPNVALQMGAFWPGFGYFEKYDTFTLGRFRQMGGMLKWTIPLDPDLALTLVQGFGTGRDGSFRYNVAANSPLYASRVGADLIAYADARLSYKKYFDIALHGNTDWTRDPYLTADASPTAGKAYSDAKAARLSVVGGEASISAPYAGRFWLSPSYISVKNGWALGGYGGTEVMHAQNGLGIATNYMAWNNDPPTSTGTGSMLNLGFLYENTLGNVLGETSEGSLPGVRLSVFGLLTSASLDLPDGTTITQKSIKQLKYGADVTVQMQTWLAFMLRGDTVNYDLDHPGYIFSAITGRLSLSSHFMSGESIYLQYSRYIYGDRMLLAGQWPWGSPLVAGTDVIQGGTYFGKAPDENVIKLQATIVF